MEIPDLHINPHAFGIPIVSIPPCLQFPLALRFQKAVCGMVWILSGIAQFIYHIGQQDAAYWDRIFTSKPIAGKEEHENQGSK